eukprot:5422194-Amphidinium_carterae.2
MMLQRQHEVLQSKASRLHCTLGPPKDKTEPQRALKAQGQVTIIQQVIENCCLKETLDSANVWDAMDN